MTKLSRFKPLAVAVAAALAAFACGGTSSSGGGGGNKGELDIGVDLPMSGSDASNGVPTLNGVQYAVKKNGTIKGFKIGVVSLDDAVNGVHDPQKGAQNVQQLTSNTQVLAMVGPFNSSVAKAEIPLSNRVNMAQISPANTNPCLTKEYAEGGGCATYAGFTPSSLRTATGKNNYFRVAGTDDHQGPANADYAYNKLHITKVAVLDDAEVYGQGIAKTFAARFKQVGGQVVLGPQDYDPTSTNDFRSFLNSAKNAGAQGVYVGGTDSNKACVVRSQMTAIFGASAPFFGGDGIVTSQCLNDAAASAAGMYGTIAAVNADTLPNAKATIAGFKSVYGDTGYGAYSMPAYAATQAILAAFSRAIDDAGGNKPTRDQVRAEVAKTKNLTTVLGPLTFDKNGDNSQQVIAEYAAIPVDATHTFTTESTDKKFGYSFVQQKNYSS